MMVATGQALSKLMHFQLPTFLFSRAQSKDFSMFLLPLPVSTYVVAVISNTYKFSCYKHVKDKKKVNS